MAPATAACGCGKCTVTHRTPGGIATWRCHCSHCRAANAHDPVTKGEFGFNVVDWCCNFKVTGPTEGKCTVFQPFGCPCPLWGAYRTSCAECKQPLVSYGHGGFTGFTIMNCTAPALQPKDGLGFDSFYECGEKKAAPLARAYHGEVASSLGLLFEVLCVGLPRSSTCCCCTG